jgi:YebC/PmpR family DNA-binding regulatory protein
MGRHGTIAGRKSAQDSKRAALFTKYARAITVAAKGGGDPEYNISLKHAIDKAKAINMPNDNISRAIKKGTGELAGESYESGSFEGYGPGGVAIMVEVLTDNKNRTTSAVKHILDRFGGNLGTPGCVSYMFSQKGLIVIEKSEGVEEEALMEAALEAGAEDFIVYEDSFEILTPPEDFSQVTAALQEKGYAFVEADVEYLPGMEACPETPGDRKNLKRIIDELEENDDVQKVYHNCNQSLEEE